MSECAPFEYSQEFKEHIHRMIREPEGAPAHEQWFRMALSRVDFQRKYFLPALGRFVSLRGRRVLEIGCGTGPSSVVMAEQGASVVAVDIDPLMVKAAELRARDHGLGGAVLVQHVAHSDKLNFSDGEFDLVVCNGVLEHVRPDQRGALLREMWRVLRIGGCLFIGETPNRLWPIDDHTTGLAWLHYMPAALAIRYAKWRRRIKSGDDLHSMGGFGCTFSRLVAELPKGRARVLNLFPDYSWLTWRKRTDRGRSGRASIPRTAFLALLSAVEILVLKPVFGIPVDALMPYLSLCVEKAQPSAESIAGLIGGVI